MMRCYKYFFALFLSLVNVGISYAQEDSLPLFEIPEALIQEVENLYENSEEEEDMSDILDYDESSNKLRINELTESQAFLQLHLSDYQYYHLLKYIAETGKLVSFYELAAIEGFGYEEAQRIIPLLTLENSPAKQRYFGAFLKRAKHKLLLRYGQVLQHKAGYDTVYANHYFGSPQRYQFKYSFTSGDNFTFGVAGEKDPGEALFKGAQRYGFDFYSAHLQIKNISWLKSFILGDYRINCGQGLLLGSGLGLSGSSTDAAVRSDAVLRPVTAMSESQFFRGAALELGNYKYSAVFFYSYRFYDGNLNEDSLNDEAFIEGNVSTLGLHRTLNEIAKMNTVRSYSSGANLSLRFRQVKCGFRVLYTGFSPSFSTSEIPYQRYYFEGEDNWGGSADYRWAFKRQILFGEFAVNKLGGYAILQGAVLNVDPRWKVSLLFRHYSPNFFAYYANAYARSSRLNNETGLLLNMDILLHQKMNLFVSADFYKLHWLKYLVDKPTRNFSIMTRLNFNIARRLDFYVRYRTENRYENFNEGYYNQVNVFFRHRLTIHSNYRLCDFLSLKSSCNLIFNDYGSGDIRNGILLCQDVVWKIPKVGLSVAGRLAFFDTYSFDEAISAYENDLTETFTFCTYYAQGVKGYLVFNYRYRFLNFQCKIAHTLFSNRIMISSGLEKISGPRKTEIKCQVGIRL